MLTNDLRAARRSAGWSQRTLAERAGIESQAVKRLEQGVGSIKTLEAVMTALDFRMTGIAPGRGLSVQISAARRAKLLSISTLAEKTGLSRSTIANLEQGGGSVASLQKLLAVLSPSARRRAPERSYWGEGDKADRDSRFTPSDFMERIYGAFGEIDIDPCGHLLSPVKAQRRILLSEGGDGLVDGWSGRLAYVNPPFSEMMKWLRRAHEQWRAGNVQTVVCLVPVRTCSALFHETLSADASMYMLRGRVRFLDPRGKSQHTPFSLMILTLGATAEQKLRLAASLPGLWLARADMRMPERQAADVPGDLGAGAS